MYNGHTISAVSRYSRDGIMQATSHDDTTLLLHIILLFLNTRNSLAIPHLASLFPHAPFVRWDEQHLAKVITAVYDGT